MARIIIGERVFKPGLHNVLVSLFDEEVPEKKAVRIIDSDTVRILVDKDDKPVSIRFKEIKLEPNIMEFLSP